MSYSPVHPAISKVFYTNNGDANNAAASISTGTVAVPATPTNSRTIIGQTQVLYTDGSSAPGQNDYATAYHSGLSRSGPETPNFS